MDDLNLIKISDLPPTEHVSAGDVVPVVQNGVTKQVSSSAVRKYVVDSLGSAALAATSDFEPSGSVLEVDLKSQARADAQNERIDRIEVAAYLLRNNKVFKAYRSKALMLADVANIPAQSILTVVSDPNNKPEINDINGQYHWDGNDFFKLPDDILSLIDRKTDAAAIDAKEYADQKKIEAVNESEIYADSKAKETSDNANGYAEDLTAQVQKNLDSLGFIPEVGVSNNFDLAVTDDAGNVALAIKKDSTLKVNDLETSSASIINTDDSIFSFAIIDPSGNVGFGLKKDSTLKVSDLETSSASLIKADDSVFSYVITDSQGNVAFGIRYDGSIFPECKPQPIEIPRNMKPQKTDVQHGGTYGQSLGRGSGSYPVVSNIQYHMNMTFKSGVLARLSDPHDYSDTKPLIEERWKANSAEGESPTSGMLNKISELAQVDGEKIVFLGASSGQGGAALESLSKGTTRYNEQLAMYQAGFDLFQSRGLSYAVTDIGFVQGESNYNRGNSRKEYKQLEVQLKRDFDADIQAITNQDFIPIMTTYQTASHHVAVPRRDHVNIALAQWDAHRENEDIVMACSMYAIEYLADNLHLTADSSQQLGKYLGKAAYKTRQYALGVEDKTFRPLEPERVLWQGKVIEIEFNVPVGDLTFDTNLVKETFNHGFDIWIEDVVQETAIKSVLIVDKNRIRIVLNQSYENALLSYARGRPSEPVASGPINGPRGNIRDQAGDTDNYLDSKGMTRYMHNWCVIFQYSQTTGFN